jgi:tripartite-type tricarboxylate transporter receptor subunit TctC
MKRRSVLQAAGAAAISAAAPVGAQVFPSRTVTLIVPFPAGGPTDITMRTLAEVTALHLGQSIVVENRPGAGGTLGVVALATARPDGHTLAQIPLSVFRIPHTQKVAWNPLTDIA